MVSHYLLRYVHLNHLVNMNIRTLDSKKSYMGSDIQSLQQLLQDQVLENPASAVSYVLTFSNKENGLDTWLLRKVIEEQLSD